MKTDEKTFVVPAEIAACLSTGRGLFASQFARAVEDGKRNISTTEVAGMARLIGQAVEEREVLLRRITRLRERLVHERNERSLTRERVVQSAAWIKETLDEDDEDARLLLGDGGQPQRESSQET